MINPDDLRPTVQITAFTLTAISTLVVAIRFYCRISFVGKLKLWDYLTVVALLSTWALCICNHYQLKFSTGVQGEPEFSQVDHLAEGSAASWYAYQIIYSFALATVKVSILVFYLNFATRRTFRIAVYTTLALVSAVGITSLICVAIQCPKEPSIAWSKRMPQSLHGSDKCLDLRVLFYWQAGFNMGSDLIVLFLPMPLILHLRMRTANRLSLIAVFSAGLLVPVASAIRIWSLYQWATSGDLACYYEGYIILGSQIELNTAIICASLPSLQPYIVKVFRKLRRKRQASYYYGGEPGPMVLSPAAEAARARCGIEDSIIALERPDPIYRPLECAQVAQQATISAENPTTQEELQLVHISSIHTTIVQSQLPTFTQPMHNPTKG
ncbi:hypothetical protein GQ44DRAFT_620309 [Phaeosphaeriaceae sp. PMI808]|nr:hypothetical protein GQ44DRAFT_620309 [Phaeosphaeriaceae sp. PMI808]